MATDGDLYQKRMQCGFGKAYRVACEGGPAADEAVVVVRGFENLLRQIPMPALGPLLSAVSAVLAEHGSELYASDVAAGMQRVKERVIRIASLHASAQTTLELAAVLGEVAFERLEDGVPFSADEFQNECRKRVLKRMLRRYHFGPSEANVLERSEVRRFAAGIRETFSCDRFPDHFEGKPQCGVCSSCVLRRMSLECAGLAAFDPADDYAFDVEASNALPKPRAAFVLDKYDAQASRFHQALTAQNPWRELVRHWPDLRDVETALAEGGTPAAEIRPRLLRLLGRHAEEWSRFSGRTAFHRYLQAA